MYYTPTYNIQINIYLNLDKTINQSITVILRDKTMDDKFIYIPIDDKQNYPFCSTQNLRPKKCKISRILSVEFLFSCSGRANWTVNYAGTQSFINTSSHLIWPQNFGYFFNNLIGWFKPAVVHLFIFIILCLKIPGFSEKIYMHFNFDK